MEEEYIPPTKKPFIPSISEEELATTSSTLLPIQEWIDLLLPLCKKQREITMQDAELIKQLSIWFRIPGAPNTPIDKLCPILLQYISFVPRESSLFDILPEETQEQILFYLVPSKNIPRVSQSFYRITKPIQQEAYEKQLLTIGNFLISLLKNHYKFSCFNEAILMRDSSSTIGDSWSLSISAAKPEFFIFSTKRFSPSMNAIFPILNESLSLQSFFDPPFYGLPTRLPTGFDSYYLPESVAIQLLNQLAEMNFFFKLRFFPSRVHFIPFFRQPEGRTIKNLLGKTNEINLSLFQQWIQNPNIRQWIISFIEHAQSINPSSYPCN